MGFCRLQSRISLFGLVQIVSPLVFCFCMVFRCAWVVFLCMRMMVLRPCVCSCSVWVAFVGSCVLVSCSS